MAIGDFFRRKPKVQHVTVQDTSVAAPPPRQKIDEAMTPDTAKLSIIKKIGLAYSKNATSGRENFEGPTNISFQTIANVYLTDSYVRQSVDKHIDFLFKAGFTIRGKNDASLEYIKKRLGAMEFATSQSFESFLREVSDELIKYHNVFILKKRLSGSYQYPNSIPAIGFYSKQPVTAYFLLPTDSITIARDETGEVIKYRQEIPGVTAKSGEGHVDIRPEDMIHIYIDKPAGRAYGIPYLWEVLDDIKILRYLEELSTNMIYKNIFPLYVYTVGSDEHPAEEGEVDAVSEYLGSDFTFNGGLVIPFRHAVDVKSPGGAAMDISDYLEYYKKRVYAGLGVSPTLMGEGDTASRSTADTIDQGFKDRIKSFQKEIELAIQDKIFKELLFEGGFDFIENEENMVYFKFNEIDLTSKIQKENHLIQMFTQNAITHQELRQELGYEQLSDEETEGLYSRFISAFISAKATEDNMNAANRAGDNKNEPANQSGKKNAPGKNKEKFIAEQLDTNNNKLNNYYNALKEDIVAAITKDLTNKSLTFYANYDIIKLGMVISLAVKNIKSSINAIIMDNLIQGALDAKDQGNEPLVDRINMTTESAAIEKEAEKRIDNIISEIQENLLSAIKSSDKTTLEANLNKVFDKNEYRLRFLNNTEPMIAYNKGFILTAKLMNFKRVYIETEDTCELCTATDVIETDSDNIPPFHPNCRCRLVIRKEEQDA